MNDMHVGKLLGAYLDGELSSSQQREVHTHLESCALCRKELEELQQLSGILELAPETPAKTSPERFVAQVGLRLPRRSSPPRMGNPPSWVWWVIPAGVVATWMFMQATEVVLNTISLIGATGIGGDSLAWLFSSSGSPGGMTAAFSILAGNNAVDPVWLKRLGSGELLGWSVLLNFTISFVLVVIYWAWLALFWTRKNRSLAAERQQTTDSIQ